MKEHIRFSIFTINTIQKINVKREKKSKSFEVVEWFYNFSQHCIYIYISVIKVSHLDWCEIYNGKIDCLHATTDEKNCFSKYFLHSNILFFDYDRLDKILNEISPVLY